MLRNGTQRLASPRYQSNKMKIQNFSLARVVIEPTISVPHIKIHFTFFATSLTTSNESLEPLRRVPAATHRAPIISIFTTNQRNAMIIRQFATSSTLFILFNRPNSIMRWNWSHERGFV